MARVSVDNETEIGAKDKNARDWGLGSTLRSFNKSFNKLFRRSPSVFIWD